MHPFTRAVADSVAARLLFRPEGRVIVALSGGPDSCALLLALHEIAGERALSLHLVGAAHFHHGLRGEDADEDAAFSASLCARLGLPCVIGLGAVPSGGASPNDAARRARYAFLAEAAADLNADTIATAHTADDQAETVLGRILRGTSVGGLAGIPAMRETGGGLRVVRPLLGIRREDVEAFCRDRGITPRRDPSNEKERYARARLRLRMPGLAADFNPRLVEALCRLAEQARLDADFLENIADRLWETSAELTAPRYVRLQILPLFEAHQAVRRRVLLRALLHAVGERDADSEMDEEAAAVARENAANAESVAALEELLYECRAIDLPGGIRAEAEKDTLTVAAPAAWNVPAPYCVPLPVPGSAWVGPAALRVTAEVLADAPPLSRMRLPRRSLMVYLAADEEDVRPLAVRSAREGDRIAPLGMKGKTRLVRDVMASAKWPAPERESAPLVVRADIDEVLWIIGLAQAESTRVTAKTKRVLRLRTEPDC